MGDVIRHPFFARRAKAFRCACRIDTGSPRQHATFCSDVLSTIYLIGLSKGIAWETRMQRFAVIGRQL
jgi:hypothetical protein